jgi:beta-lactamase superfamily II metal-dependent hydrolase
VAASGFLKRKVRVDGADRQVALPEKDVRVLQVSFVDVQQGDGALVQTPSGKLITIDGGENQLFARFLAGRLRGTSAAARRPIDAMVVTHGDADHFAGLSKIRESETEEALAAHKRLFIHPERVFHNGLVKRPSTVPELEQLGPTKEAAGRTILTGLVGNPLDVPASGMNKHFKAWRKALEGWQAAGPIEFRRLARGTDDAFDFLIEDGIAVEVLGPLETQVGNVSGLAFLAEPREGKPLAHLDFEPGSLSASHTINGHSVVLRFRFGNVRMLFAGDLNNAAEEALLAEHAAGRIDLESEVLKVPHHGSHEFTPGFLAAVSPVVSVVSSGDETSRTEFIHPRATLMNALGRHSRGDFSLVFVTEMVAFSKWPAGSPRPPS